MADLPFADIAAEGRSAVIADVSQVSLESFGTLPSNDQSVADLISLSDFSNFFDLREMTLGLAIQSFSRDEAAALTLASYPFLSEVTISEIARLTKSYDVLVSELPLALIALETFLNHPNLAIEKRLTLEQVLKKYPDIGSVKLGLLDLSLHSYRDIPGLLNIPLTQIPNWQKVRVSDIPGLEKVIIDGRDKLDGNIVQLNAIRDEGRIKVRLQDESGLAMDWEEEPEYGLSPFGSYSTVATIHGEKIKTSAYFRSCSENAQCSFIGPFNLQEYDKGDFVYVSKTDWAQADREDSFLELQITTEEEKALPVTEADVFPDERKFIHIAIAVTSGLCVSGASLFYFLLSGLRRKS